MLSCKQIRLGLCLSQVGEDGTQDVGDAAVAVRCGCRHSSYDVIAYAHSAQFRHDKTYSFHVKLTSATFNNASTRYIINPKSMQAEASHSLSKS